jgi:hypothetical protein
LVPKLASANAQQKDRSTVVLKPGVFTPRWNVRPSLAPRH